MYTAPDMQNTGPSSDLILKEVFEQVFRVSEVHEDDSMETIPLWDSFGHMELITAVENRFSIRIEPEEIAGLTSVPALKEYLRRRLP